MIEIWTVLIPILIADALNPVLFAFMVFAAGTRRPIVNSSAILMGHTLAYFSVGIVMALGLERITDRLMNPHTMDYVIGLLVGILFSLPYWVREASRSCNGSTRYWNGPAVISCPSFWVHWALRSLSMRSCFSQPAKGFGNPSGNLVCGF